jgi:hypothetical protein
MSAERQQAAILSQAALASRSGSASIATGAPLPPGVPFLPAVPLPLVSGTSTAPPHAGTNAESSTPIPAQPHQATFFITTEQLSASSRFE